MSKTAVAIKERPILMTDGSPSAILEDRKTQTRRLWGLKQVNISPDDWELLGINSSGLWEFRNKRNALIVSYKCPYGKVGERLWVKEAWATQKSVDRFSPSYIGNAGTVPLWYKADADNHSLLERGKWRSSMFIPRWASRILLEITGVRVERVQEITEGDARAEGVTRPPNYSLSEKYIVQWFKVLWDSINDKRSYGWNMNPWVGAITFRRIKQ